MGSAQERAAGCAGLCQGCAGSVPRCDAPSPREPRQLSFQGPGPGGVRRKSPARRLRPELALPSRVACPVESSRVRPWWAVGCGLWTVWGLPWPRYGCVGPSHPVEPRLIAVISHSLAAFSPIQLNTPSPRPSQPRQFRWPLPSSHWPSAQIHPPHLPGSRGEGQPLALAQMMAHDRDRWWKVVGGWAVTD